MNTSYVRCPDCQGAGGWRLEEGDKYGWIACDTCGGMGTVPHIEEADEPDPNQLSLDF